MTRHPFAAAGAVLAAALLALPVTAPAQGIPQGPKNVPAFHPAFPNQTRAPAVNSGVTLSVQTVAGGLVHPWGLAVLPDGSYLVTERPGRLRHVARDGKVSAPIRGVPKVLARGQGGLLDVTLSPGFAQDRKLWLSYARPLGGGKSVTAVAVATLSPDRTALTGVHDIIEQTPPSPTPMQYGSRVTVDGNYLFITMGEHFTPSERKLAQDLSTTYGKVLRLTLDGRVPADNPFVGRQGARPEIWSYGHRNPEGAAVDAGGQYWEIEHGPKGGDELNRIEPGKNYGWPVISYGEDYSGTPVGKGISKAPGMEQPVYYWDPVIAPAGATFYDGAMFPQWKGSLLISSLTPGGLNRLVLKGGRVTGEEKLLPDIGRVRDVVQDADGSLLILTDAQNGAVLRLVPKSGR